MTTLYIILAADAAAAVRGISSAGHSLEPLLLADGVTFVLPADVLADPGHASRYDILGALPQREVRPDEWPADAMA